MYAVLLPQDNSSWLIKMSLIIDSHDTEGHTAFMTRLNAAEVLTIKTVKANHLWLICIELFFVTFYFLFF